MGKSKGGLTTKIHAVADGLGNPIRIALSAGNIHDIVPAGEMLSGLHPFYVLADRAYDCNKFIRLAESQGAQAVIPPRRNRIDQREYDRHIYKERHLVECFFAKIKKFRRVSTRYDKLERIYRAPVMIAACMVCLH